MLCIRLRSNFDWLCVLRLFERAQKYEMNSSASSHARTFRCSDETDGVVVVRLIVVVVCVDFIVVEVEVVTVVLIVLGT